MTVIRTYHNPENPYVQLHSDSLRSHMSWAATGLFAFMFSFKNDWEFNMVDLARRKKETNHSTFKAMRELIEEGFAIRYQPTIMKNGRSSRGKIHYIVFEQTMPMEERQKIVLAMATQPYFPDISKPSKKLKQKDQTIQEDEEGEEYEESEEKPDLGAPAAQREIARAQTAQAPDRNLSNNDKASINKGIDINESLPFSINENKSLKKASPPPKPKAMPKLTPAPAPKPESKARGGKGYKLTDEQFDAFEWLKGQGINTDDDTLSWWAKSYPFQRLQDVVNFAHQRRKAGQSIPNMGGWIHKLLKTGLAVVNDVCKENRQFAEDYRKSNKWTDLKIFEKYVKDEVTDDDLPLTMASEAFIPALMALHQKSELYKGI